MDQWRAEDALSKVRSLPPGDHLRRSYRAYVDRLGPAIIMNGLGQALATECAAAGSSGGSTPDERAHHELYRNVSSWLCRDGDGVYPSARADDLLAALTAGDQSAYLRAQVEALAWLTWHKKFCHAELPTSAAARDGGVA